VSRTKTAEAEFDPGATLCGHGPLHPTRTHYLGGGLWVCFECLAKLLLGSRAPRKEAPCK
jgi:hypothetical protein